jgi:triosephosphate isomerase
MLILGNWKMHKTVADAIPFAVMLKAMEIPRNAEVGVLPPYVDIMPVANILEGSGVKFGAQNCHFEDSGAYTGEISPTMLQDLGCTWCLTGHSERRKLFFETDDLIRRKVVALLRHKIKPVLCVGETIEERNQDRTFAVLSAQLTRALESLDLGTDFIVAYEPVWAIGTGIVAKPKQVGEAHAFIMSHLNRMHPLTKYHLLYGGSVTPTNCKELIQENVHGFLVGGASCKIDSFQEIILSAS